MNYFFFCIKVIKNNGNAHMCSIIVFLEEQYTDKCQQRKTNLHICAKDEKMLHTCAANDKM